MTADREPKAERCRYGDRFGPGVCRAFVVLVLLAELARAQTPATQSTFGGDQGPASALPDDLMGASPRSAAGGAELLLFQDIPVIVSAARQAQPMNMLSVPVSIITAEDIHYSGLTTLPELLQFVPGVDVLKVDRNNFAIGVRGLHHTFADRTLVLINGRDAASPAVGGADFLVLPIFMEDIERIEVVRGPGGAAWGANAFNGVINIITKKPEDVRGFLATSTIDHFGDTYSQLRWADVSGNWSWRVSLGYENRVATQDAIGDNIHFESLDPRIEPFIGFGTISTNDFLRNYRIDTEGAYRFSETTRLSFGLAAASAQRGDMELIGDLTSQRAESELARAFARLDFNPSHNTSGYLQWFGNFEHLEHPVLTRVRTLENDLESQLTFAPGHDHKLTVGGNMRAVQVNNEDMGPTDLMRGVSADETWAGAFAIDRWDVSDRLAIEAQGRLDYYSATGGDWSGRLSSLYAVDTQKHHILRLSAAKAFRAPSVGLRETSGNRVFVPPPAPPNTAIVNFLQNDKLTNEETISVETGYNGQLADGQSLRIDGYYQRYQDLIGAARLPDPLGFGREFDRLDNLGGADGYGVETELAYTRKDYKLSLWYAYNGIALDSETTNTRSFLPAKNNAGATARWFIGDGWTLNANYRFSDKTPNDLPDTGGQADARNFNRLDLSVSKSLFDHKAEVMVGVEDLLDDTGFTVIQDGSFTGHDTPGRTFFIRLQAKF